MGDPVQEDNNSATILPVQCRMARIAVGWGVRDLAKAAGVGTDTVARMERGETLYPRTLFAIRTALEEQGAQFSDFAFAGQGLQVWRSKSR